MSLPDTPTAGAAMAPGALVRRPARLLARLAVVGLLSGALAGCFQPLYADNATVGGPGLQEKLQDVEVMEIKGRLGDELRNELIYLLGGGAGNPKGATFQIYTSTSTTSSTALVNSSSGLAENAIMRVAANWRLVRADDDKKKPVAGGEAVGTASVDLSDQRFANYSAQNDAQARASRAVAEQIKAELVAYFLRAANELPKPQPAKASGS
ncbi:LPS assembly lipoprotein LptE [Xanthobacter variabilis]|uniref:LPS assembly lipoprotein LptE n=1 Tax=Xanthobacter variabilis TaxID=3119932 RepID=UPI00372C607F